MGAFHTRYNWYALRWSAFKDFWLTVSVNMTWRYYMLQLRNGCFSYLRKKKIYYEYSIANIECTLSTLRLVSLEIPISAKGILHLHACYILV